MSVTGMRNANPSHSPESHVTNSGVVAEGAPLYFTNANSVPCLAPKSISDMARIILPIGSWFALALLTRHVCRYIGATRALMTPNKPITIMVSIRVYP